LSHSTSPSFCVGFFRDRVSRSLGWLWTVILLISASQVATITGMSHWQLAAVRELINTAVFTRHIIHLTHKSVVLAYRVKITRDCKRRTGLNVCLNIELE
jgi:hypothetical protein